MAGAAAVKSDSAGRALNTVAVVVGSAGADLGGMSTVTEVLAADIGWSTDCDAGVKDWGG